MESRVTTSRDGDIHSSLRSSEGRRQTETRHSDAPSWELDLVGDLIFQVMNTNIESSTEGARVKSDAPVDDQYALWNLMNNQISTLFPFPILVACAYPSVPPPALLCLKASL